MNEYLLTDAYGNSWGTWIAVDEFDAISQLDEDVTYNPDAYMGEPIGIVAQEVH